MHWGAKGEREGLLPNGLHSQDLEDSKLRVELLTTAKLQGDFDKAHAYAITTAEREEIEEIRAELKAALSSATSEQESQPYHLTSQPHLTPKVNTQPNPTPSPDPNPDPVSNFHPKSTLSLTITPTLTLTPTMTKAIAITPPTS